MKNLFSFITIRKDMFRLLPINKYQFKTYFIYTSILKIFGIITAIAGPYIYKILIDSVVIGKNLKLLINVCILSLILFLVNSIIGFLGFKLDQNYYLKTIYKVKMYVYRFIQYLPIGKIKTYSSGELKNIVEDDINIIQAFLSSQIIGFTFNIIYLLVYTFVIYIICWELAIIGFLSVPVSYIIAKAFGKISHKLEREYRDNFSKYENWLFNSLSAWKEIKLLNSYKIIEKRFVGFWRSLSKTFFSKYQYWTLNKLFVSLKDLIITNMSIFFVGGYFVIIGKMTVGSLLVFMQYFSYLLSYINTIANSHVELNEQIVHLKKIIEILNLKEISIAEKKLNDESYIKAIEIKNISYCYNTITKKILDNLSITILPGQHIGIMGKSGEGKSTLLKIIFKQIIPNSGNIYIDNVDINLINNFNYYKHVGVVLQDSYLFNTSIRENFLLVNPNLKEADMIDACQQVNIYGTIYNFPDKLDTIIGENGIKLSGGEKQRILLARLIMQDPQIIVLDESTSSLDNLSEAMFLSFLKTKWNYKTVIFVTHKIYKENIFDKLYRLKDGRLVEESINEE